MYMKYLWIRKYNISNPRIPINPSENVMSPSTTRTSSSIRRTLIQLLADSAISSSPQWFRRNEWNSTHLRRPRNTSPPDWAATRISIIPQSIMPLRTFHICTKTFRRLAIWSRTSREDTLTAVRKSWPALIRNSVYCCPIRLRTLRQRTSQPPHWRLAMQLALVPRVVIMLMVSRYEFPLTIQKTILTLNYFKSDMHDDQYGDNLDEPRKKKYAKEAWPGRKPLLSPF